MTEGLVLPSLRLIRLQRDITRIVGDREAVYGIMEAIERHLEQGAQRWGNVCPLDECGQLLSWTNDAGFRCSEHGLLGRHAATKLLISFNPITTPEDTTP